MNFWELIFRQSKANDGEYYGERLAVQPWEWPQGTWFQERLRFLRSASERRAKEPAAENPLPIQ
ncbi:MAG TPA: hypothetical protein VNN13_02325 [Methylomirabilota bacterium]|nr:hypothetical protein [Methylomirabilota bacterium]